MKLVFALLALTVVAVSAAEPAPEGVSDALWKVLTGETPIQGLTYDDLVELDSVSEDKNKIIPIPNEGVKNVLTCDACRVASLLWAHGIVGPASRLPLASDHELMEAFTSDKLDKEDLDSAYGKMYKMCEYGENMFGLSLVRGGIGHFIEETEEQQTLHGSWITELLGKTCVRFRDEHWNDAVKAYYTGEPERSITALFQDICMKDGNGFCTANDAAAILPTLKNTEDALRKAEEEHKATLEDRKQVKFDKPEGDDEAKPKDDL